MCQWYCTSEGPFTNLHCLHCHVRYCGACLHGEAGKMESLVKCAGCGRKPRVKANAQRRGWGHEVASPIGTSKTVLSPPQRGKSTQAYWAYKQAADSQGGFTWDASTQKRTIFDKLTDPTLYTGSHKHRFDEEGRGRGLEGRDSVAKGLGTNGVTAYYGDGPVVSIAQLVRNEKLDPQHMNKIRRFPDGTSILSPQNRSWKGEDSKWRPEIERGVYPQNNPTYHRTPGSSPRASRTPGSASARSMSYSASQGHMMPPHDVTMLSSPQYPQQHQQQQHHQSPQQYQQQQPYHPSQQSNYQQRPASASYYPAQQQQQHQQQHHEQQAEEFEQAAAASSNWSASRGPSSRVPEKATPAAYQSSPIFDKLTDPSLYTGTHRQRFDEQGSEPQQQQIQASSASSSSSHPPPPPPTEAELELQRAREEVAALQAQVQRLQLSAYHQEQYHSPRAPTATTAGGQ